MENYHRMRRPVTVGPAVIAAAAFFMVCFPVAGIEPQVRAASTAFVVRASSSPPLPEAHENSGWFSPSVGSTQSEENAAAMQPVIQRSGQSRKRLSLPRDTLGLHDYAKDRGEKDESRESKSSQEASTSKDSGVGGGIGAGSFTKKNEETGGREVGRGEQEVLSRLVELPHDETKKEGKGTDSDTLSKSIPTVEQARSADHKTTSEKSTNKRSSTPDEELEHHGRAGEKTVLIRAQPSPALSKHAMHHEINDKHSFVSQSRDTPTTVGTATEEGQKRVALTVTPDSAARREELKEQNFDAERPFAANEMLQSPAGVPGSGVNAPEQDLQTHHNGARRAPDLVRTFPVNNEVENDREAPWEGHVTEWNLAESQQKSNSATAAAVPTRDEPEHVPPTVIPEVSVKEDTARWNKTTSPAEEPSSQHTEVPSAPSDRSLPHTKKFEAQLQRKTGNDSAGGLVFPFELVTTASEANVTLPASLFAAQANVRERQGGNTTPCDTPITDVATEQGARGEACLEGRDTYGGDITGETSSAHSWISKKISGEERTDVEEPEETQPSLAVPLHKKVDVENAAREEEEDFELVNVPPDGSSLAPRTHFGESKLAKNHSLPSRNRATEEQKEGNLLHEVPSVEREVMKENTQKDKILEKNGELAATGEMKDEHQMHSVAALHKERKKDEHRRRYQTGTSREQGESMKTGDASTVAEDPASSSGREGPKTVATTRGAYGGAYESRTLASTDVAKNVASTRDIGSQKGGEEGQPTQPGEQGDFGTGETEGRLQHPHHEKDKEGGEHSGHLDPYERENTRLSQHGRQEGPQHALQQTGGAARGRAPPSSEAAGGPPSEGRPADPSSGSGDTTLLRHQDGAFPLSVKFGFSSAPSSASIVDEATRPHNRGDMRGFQEDTERQARERGKREHRYPSAIQFLYDSVIDSAQEGDVASTLPARTGEQPKSQDPDSFPQTKLERVMPNADSTGTEDENSASPEGGETSYSLRTHSLGPAKTGTKGEIDFVSVGHRTREAETEDEPQTKEGRHGRNSSTPKLEHDAGVRLVEGNAGGPSRAGISENKVRGDGADRENTSLLHGEWRIQEETSAASAGEAEEKLEEQTESGVSANRTKRERNAYDQKGEQTKEEENAESATEQQDDRSDATKIKESAEEHGRGETRQKVVRPETETEEAGSAGDPKREGGNAAKIDEGGHSKQDVQQQTQDTDRAENGSAVGEGSLQADGEPGIKTGEDKKQEQEARESMDKTESATGVFLTGRSPTSPLSTSFEHARSTVEETLFPGDAGGQASADGGLPFPQAEEIAENHTNSIDETAKLTATRNDRVDTKGPVPSSPPGDWPQTASLPSRSSSAAPQETDLLKEGQPRFVNAIQDDTTDRNKHEPSAQKTRENVYESPDATKAREHAMDQQTAKLFTSQFQHPFEPNDLPGAASEWGSEANANQRTTNIPPVVFVPNDNSELITRLGPPTSLAETSQRTQLRYKRGPAVSSTTSEEALQVKQRNVEESSGSFGNDVSDAAHELGVVPSPRDGTRDSERQPTAGEVRAADKTFVNEESLASSLFPAPELQGRFTMARGRESPKQTEAAHAPAAQVRVDTPVSNSPPAHRPPILSGTSPTYVLSFGRPLPEVNSDNDQMVTRPPAGEGRSSTEWQALKISEPAGSSADFDLLYSSQGPLPRSAAEETSPGHAHISKTGQMAGPHDGLGTSLSAASLNPADSAVPVAILSERRKPETPRNSFPAAAGSALTPAAPPASGAPANTGTRETYATLESSISGVDIITLPDNLGDMLRNPGMQIHRPMSIWSSDRTSSGGNGSDANKTKATATGSATKKIYDPTLTQSPTMFDQFMEQEAAEGITPGADLLPAPAEAAAESQGPNDASELQATETGGAEPPSTDEEGPGNSNDEDDEDNDDEDDDIGGEEEEPQPRRTYPIPLPLPIPISIPWLGGLGGGGGLGLLSVRGPSPPQPDAHGVFPVDPSTAISVGGGVHPNLAPSIPLKVEERAVSSIAAPSSVPPLRASSAGMASGGSAGAGVKTRESAGSGGLAAAGSVAGVARQLPGATTAVPAIVQSADQLFTSTSSFIGVGNSLIKSFPFEEALEWSQQRNEARRQQKDQPPAHLGHPWVRCVSSGMTCCLPQKAVGGDWKKKPPYLNDSQAENRACQAHFVPMQNAVCASTAYKDNECGIQRMETSQFVLFRHVLHVRGSKNLKAVCECRWARSPGSSAPPLDGKAAVLAEVDDEKLKKERDVAPVGSQIEGFASWQVSKKAIAEKQQRRDKTNKMTQGVGAALKTTALLTQQGSDAMHSSLAGMERAQGDPAGQVQEIRGGVEAIADLLMKASDTTPAMSIVTKALDDLAYVKKK
ncbi:conserved hypothetical protein [Neospora caninum Liverpool]|uniref:Uncharacterized protein n=1 Tax=Neospora caninum (strain Liverpool) TaxID=572307 RepID=F0VFM6_NEOCL|nr:conserved hypothetical protein [Neospora caninum Liverpool]CBZ52520.1 conserved hypothetical protein [Neospora caninum Liverpool]|eukprot:XP_003882552.1 conserved hypothetical protein [Neospora caninum Liverpool]